MKNILVIGKEEVIVKCLILILDVNTISHVSKQKYRTEIHGFFSGNRS